MYKYPRSYQIHTAHAHANIFRKYDLWEMKRFMTLKRFCFTHFLYDFTVRTKYFFFPFWLHFLSLLCKKNISLSVYYYYKVFLLACLPFLSFILILRFGYIFVLLYMWIVNVIHIITLTKYIIIKLYIPESATKYLHCKYTFPYDYYTNEIKFCNSFWWVRLCMCFPSFFVLIDTYAFKESLMAINSYRQVS